LPNRRIWLLRMVPSIRYGKFLTAVALFLVCLPLFYLGVLEDTEDSAPGLFFSLVLAYIIPMFSHITARAQDALLELKPRLHITEEDFNRAMSWLQSTPSWGAISQVLFGATCAFMHMSFVEGSVGHAISEAMRSLSGATSIAGAMELWIVMTGVISMLVQQAFVFARLGRDYVEISLLNVAALAPFARVSISSSLAIIGALALFPLIGLENGLNMMEILPGALATLAPLIGMFIIPVWPVHRRLAELKQQQLADINAKVEAQTQALGKNPGIEQLEQLAPLLNYRREIHNAPTWPFDLGNVTRLMLYLIIPPLTWIAAALMENLIDSLL